MCDLVAESNRCPLPLKSVEAALISATPFEVRVDAVGE